jgi:hypothetical protein
VLNATLLIVPIPLATARRLIPARYGILERAYRSVLPADFPADMYPLLVQAAHDHDVQLKAYDITLDDFSVGVFLNPHRIRDVTKDGGGRARLTFPSASASNSPSSTS